MTLPVKSLYSLVDQFRLFPQSEFGYRHKFDIHTGVDIYTADRASVFPIEKGIIVDYGIFTGPKVGSPWWNETYYTVVKSFERYWLYGEIGLSGIVKHGIPVNVKDELGLVIPVLKENKNCNPRHMLHIELYSNYTEPVVWLDKQPYGLQDPTHNLFRG